MKIEVLLLALLVSLSQQASFKTIQAAYESIEQQPQLPKQVANETIASQVDEFRRRVVTPDWKDFKGDPALNGQIILDEKKPSQSLWFMGNELDELKIQISIHHDYNREKKSNPQNEGIYVYLVNYSDRTVPFSCFLHRILVKKINIDSDLHAVMLKLPEGSAERKVVDVKMSLKSNIKRSHGKLQEDSIFNQMKYVHDSSEQVFLDSLEKWEEIKSQKTSHINQQSNRTFTSFLELALILFFNIVEIMLLKSQIQKKVIVI